MDRVGPVAPGSWEFLRSKSSGALAVVRATAEFTGAISVLGGSVSLGVDCGQ
jgi:hypothetical protein